MNSINEILKLLEKKVNSYSVKEPPTKAEIIDALCTLGVDNPGFDNTSKVQKITSYVLKIIKKYELYFIERKKDINLQFLAANNGGYRLIKVHFSEDNISGINSICLFIPVISDTLENTVCLIENFSTKNSK